MNGSTKSLAIMNGEISRKNLEKGLLDILAQKVLGYGVRWNIVLYYFEATQHGDVRDSQEESIRQENVFVDLEEVNKHCGNYTDE
ncbi:hypothetical protein ACH5RR_029118 [Cinchona calisaya]|uniref:Uncharacterized protein n=1 Tax=Cinchona calisaya TaxID=153742 RepID=A0ABD2YV63_9GENT